MRPSERIRTRLGSVSRAFVEDVLAGVSHKDVRIRFTHADGSAAEERTLSLNEYHEWLKTAPEMGLELQWAQQVN